MSRSAARAAPVFAALGDETRLGLMARLGLEGPLSVTQLSEGVTVTRQAVTKHVDVLTGAGLVKSEKRGRERIVRLEERRLEDARRYLDEVSRGWDEALERLRAHVEGDEK